MFSYEITESRVYTIEAENADEAWAKFADLDNSHAITTNTEITYVGNA